MHETYMQLAIEQAQAAAAIGEVPVGAVVLRDGEILAAAHNLRESAHDPTAHAELLAIRAAATAKGDWRLDDCTLYITLEPCPMCAGAILLARIPHVVYGATDPKAGAAESMFQLLTDARLNHRAELTTGVLAQQCGGMLTAFFRHQRSLGKK